MAATLKVLESTQGKTLARVTGPLGRHPGTKAKISRVLRTLLDALDDEDLSAVVRVYREAMGATRTFFLPPHGKGEKGRWATEPDHKTRIAAANMVAAYMEGLPIQRQLTMRGEFAELGEMINEMRASGEAARLMPAQLLSLPSTSESEGK